MVKFSIPGQNTFVVLPMGYGKGVNLAVLAPSCFITY